ncbi:MAG TPA: type II toxin-antitoxin system VapC family toxin [Acidimicrobiales bacterium]|nr:type II toxin-antitoxin system VapC family toxin [Acidimicrobiales bacterium]
MSDRVLDASAVVLALAGKTPDAEALRARLPEMRRHAPHLIDAEVGNVLRRHEAAGRISPEEADAARGACQVIIEHRYPHTGPLSEAAWALRHQLSFYDALYVALAARLGISLVTADRRLGRAPGLPCDFELV